MLLSEELRTAVVSGLTADGWPEARATDLVNNFETCALAVRNAGVAQAATVEVSTEALFSAVYAFGQVLGINMTLGAAED